MKKKLLVLAFPLLAACGATQGSGGGGTLGAYRPAQSEAQARSQVGSAGAPASSSSSSVQFSAAGGTSGQGAASTALAPAGGTLSLPSKSADATAPPLPSGQHLELAASIDVQMTHGHFQDGLNQLISIVTTEHGYLAGSDASGTGSTGLHSGTFTFEVPADSYQDTLNKFRGIGKFLGLHSSSKSHDSEYVDLQARLQSAQLQLGAYNALLAKATSISDIIAIEQQVGQVEQQIEQYQGQLNYLDSITQFATVAVVLTEAGAAPVPRPLPDQWGFAGSFQQVLHNLATIGNGLILVLGTLLPFLLLAGAAFYVTRRRWLPALERP